MGSDPKFLLSNIEISRVTWRIGSNANELVVDVDVSEGGDMEMDERADTDSLKTESTSHHDRQGHGALFHSRSGTGTTAVEMDEDTHKTQQTLPLVDMDPFAKDHPVSPSTPSSRPSSKEGRGTIRATRVGVYEPRPAYKELGFRTYSYRQ